MTYATAPSVSTASQTAFTTATRRTALPRILCIEANEDGTVGGSHQVMFDLVRLMDRSRFEPVALFYQDNPFIDRLRALGVEVHLMAAERGREISLHLDGRVVSKLRAFVEPIMRRVRFLRRHRIALVHINNSPRVGKDDWLPAARMLGIPCIANVVGDASGEEGLLKRWLFRSFDVVLPMSHYLADAMRRHGYGDDRIRLAYGGIDIDAFLSRVTRPGHVTRRELGVSDETMLVAMVGNVREWKGQHVVVEALRHLDPEIRQRLLVLFIGATRSEDEDYVRGLRTAVESSGLDRCVRFLGSRDDIPDLLEAADVALHASVKPEPFGLVIVEGMAMGKTVVAANTGGPAEVLDESSGITYDVRHPEQLARILAELVRDPERRARLGETARVRSRQFDSRRAVESTEQVYHGLLRRGL